jgi:arylsulfatase A-like enzyme
MHGISRRAALRLVIVVISLAQQVAATDVANDVANAKTRPNVILAMSDDQGWADAGFAGHPTLKTPHLDAMAANGLRFDRFYSSSPVCSPTRASCLTGRHPFRYGIFGANAGGPTKPCRYVLPGKEITIAELLRDAGYATGHFGKWHLGDIAGDSKSSPSEHGFDEWFSTVRKVSTLHPDASSYRHNGAIVKGPLAGDDSRIIMDRAVPFIRDSVSRKKPFLAVIWFHTPHLPIAASERHRALYPDGSKNEPDYWGALTAMDEQIGRLRKELRALGVSRDTMFWFTSDNGPEGGKASGKSPGTAGPLRGRKRQLFEGGVRVPGLLEWPARIPKARRSSAICSTHDYLPTIAEALGLKSPALLRPLDGVSLLPLIDGKPFERKSPLGFETRGQKYPRALIGRRFKLLLARSDAKGAEPELLFDLDADPSETTNVVAKHPDVAARMRAELERWLLSKKRSLSGADYR